VWGSVRLCCVAYDERMLCRMSWAAIVSHVMAHIMACYHGLLRMFCVSTFVVSLILYVVSHMMCCCHAL
jgi:hypothetical protein